MKRTVKWLVVVLVLTIVFGASAMVYAQPRLGRGDAPALTRDVLVDRLGLSPKQAEKVIQVHQRHAARMENALDKHRHEVEKIHRSEMEALSKIVSEEQLPKLEKLLKRAGRSLPRVQQRAPMRGRGATPDIGGWQERLKNLRGLTPEQKEKVRELIESHRQQLRNLHERFREAIQEILTSEQVKKLRSRFQSMR